MGRRTLMFAAVLLFGSSYAVLGADPSSGSLGPTRGATLQFAGTAPGGINPGPQLSDHDSFCADGATFEVPAGKIGALVYHFAKSTAGGAADVYLDNASRGSVSYSGSTGSLHAPVFGAQLRFDNLSAGKHTFELRNISGVAYVDRFCVERAYATGMPHTGPG